MPRLRRDQVSYGLAALARIPEAPLLSRLGRAAGQGAQPGITRAIDLRKTKSINFGELRNGAPVLLSFGRDGAIYEQYYLGTDASCYNDDDEDWAPSVSER